MAFHPTCRPRAQGHSSFSYSRRCIPVRRHSFMNSSQNSTFSSQFHCTAMKLSMWVIDSVLGVSRPGFQSRVFWAESPGPDFLVSKMKDLDTINLYGYSTCEMLLFFWNLKLIDIFLILSLKLYHIKPRIIEGIQISFGYDCCSSHFKGIWDNILSFIYKSKSMWIKCVCVCVCVCSWSFSSNRTFEWTQIHLYTVENMQQSHSDFKRHCIPSCFGNKLCGYYMHSLKCLINRLLLVVGNSRLAGGREQVGNAFV